MKKSIYSMMIALLFIGAVSVNAQVTIGSQDNPHAGAVLDLKSTSKGLLLPNVALDSDLTKFVLDGEANKSTATGMLVYNTTDKQVYFWDGAKWGSINGSKDNIKTVTIAGLTFIDRNLGANPSASAFPATYNAGTDAEPTGNLNGDYYQWGRVADGHQKWDSNALLGPTSDDDGTGQISQGSSYYGKFITTNGGNYDWKTTQNDNLWNGTDGGSANPCPSGYRVPTKNEWLTVKPSLTWNNSAKGMTGGSDFFLPGAGYRKNDSGAFGYVGSYGGYWSSTVSGTNVSGVGFNAYGFNVGDSGRRADGLSVRCIKK